MNELKCPHCQQIFTVDENNMADIIKQVRDHQFQEEINTRLKALEQEKNNEFKIIQMQQEKNSMDALNASKSEIEKLRSEIELIRATQASNLEQATAKLKEEKLILENQLQSKDLEKKELELNLKQKLDNQISIKETEITILKEEIEKVKNMKLKLSTKMVGESLEQFCADEFTKYRSMGLFRDAFFGKDNDATSGTKGDYIFREMNDEDEVVSIMFEMKNESEETIKKQTNRSFLDKLDKDRNQKKCEYAVLVSMLETESDLYNEGIVDMSHEFPKMYVIRPQFFIKLISILRNEGLNSLKYKKELRMVKSQEIDISRFQDKMEDFKVKWSRNVRLAGDKFTAAITQIDKSIKALNDTRDFLLDSQKYLDASEKNTEELTIKKLTYNNPTMKEKFKDSDKD